MADAPDLKSVGRKLPWGFESPRRYHARTKMLPLESDPSIETRMRLCGIRNGDLEETFTRSSGPGGQNVNKVSSRVTIRHLPTGISVTASDSRSQSQNRQIALKRLIGIFETQRAQKRQERLAAASKARRQKADRSRATKRKLVEGKRRRSETKKLRGQISG